MDNFEIKLEHHEGFYAAANDIPFDENASEAWKEGYRDGYASLFGDDDDWEFIATNKENK